MITRSLIIRSKELIPYKGYKLHGKFIGWRDNGNKWHEWEYKNDKSHGKHITWYADGSKMCEWQYKNGIRIK